MSRSSSKDQNLDETTPQDPIGLAINSEAPPPNSLERLMTDETWMKDASTGSTDALTRFYQALLAAEVVVPDRSNIESLKDSIAADYPRSSIPWFAIKGKVVDPDQGGNDEERTILPFFSSVANIVDWCGRELSNTRIIFSSFLKSVPEDWWLCLNPGSELEKEFSPWEVSLLKQGLEALPEIVADWQSQQEPRSANVQPLALDQYPIIIKCLKDFGAAEKSVRAISALLETSQTEDGDSRSILIGCELTGVDETQLIELKDRLNDLLRLNTIGEDPFRVFASSEDHPDPFFSIFNFIPAVFEREDESKDA